MAVASSRNKKSSTAAVTYPYLVAIDVGFGEIKYISNAKPYMQSIPSLAEIGRVEAANSLSEGVIDPDKLIVSTEEGTYFVGYQANLVSTETSKRTLVRNRASDNRSRVFFKTGIALALPDEDGEYEVIVPTGLPNADYEKSIKDNLEDFLSSPFEVTFHVGAGKSVTKKIKVKQLDIMRQPEGSVTWNQFMFLDKPDPNTGLFFGPGDQVKSRIGVIDFGHVTTDFALFNDGVIGDTEMSDSSSGVTDAYKRLRKELTRYFDAEGYEDFNATDEDLDAAVKTGHVQYVGRDWKVEEQVTRAAKKVASDIAKDVLDTWGRETNRLEGILVSGGGSNLFAQHVRQVFAERNAQGFEIVESPQFSNVLGFYLRMTINLLRQYQPQEIFENYVAPIVKGLDD
jgi:Actin like proteins N terminal domain/StbA protein